MQIIHDLNAENEELKQANIGAGIDAGDEAPEESSPEIAG